MTIKEDNYKKINEQLKQLYQLKSDIGCYLRIQNMIGLGLEEYEFEEVCKVQRTCENLEKSFDDFNLNYIMKNDYPETRKDVIEFAKYQYDLCFIEIDKLVELMNEIYLSELNNQDKTNYLNKIGLITNLTLNLANSLGSLINKLIIGYEMNKIDPKIKQLLTVLHLNCIHHFKGAKLREKNDGNVRIFKFYLYRKINEEVLNKVIESIMCKYGRVKVQVKYIDLLTGKGIYEK